MADQLMDVISGASHGSYSFIQDNYIYRINKFTHKRVYLSCRLSKCRGAGKGLKGATRGEVYGFKLSKPHNHPPEESKIKHFEVKEYVREEARCTKDSTKDIYERAVKLFDCYDLSRACVDGLVKRSRGRAFGEDEKTVRQSAGENDAFDAEEIIGGFMPEQEFQTRSASSTAENETNDASTINYLQVENEEVHVEGGSEPCIEVVISGEEESQQREVEFVVDERINEDITPDHEELIVNQNEVSDPGSDLDESHSPEELSSESDSSSEIDSAEVVPRKRLKNIDGEPMNVSPRRSPRERKRVGVNLAKKRRLLSDLAKNRREEKHLSIEESLIKIFSSTYFTGKDNVFNLMSNPEFMPEDDAQNNALHSTNSLNVIKSASKLCTFTAVKASQMKNLLKGKTNELKVLEGVLLEHLGNLMCFSGTEFFQKCFDLPLREAIEQGKNEERKGKAIWNEEENYKKMEHRKNVIQLAVALQCYSGKAYTALGELIDLPGPNIARKWATNSVGNPGFSAQSFAAIRSEASASRSKSTLVCLSMEDVQLKTSIDFSDNQLFGFTDLGYGRVESDSIPESSRAVVFYAAALNSHWKVPLGYCLADNLSSQVRANLISQYVSKLEFNGVKCVAVVLNNSTLSTQIYEEFGVIVKNALPLGAFHTNADEKIRVSPFVDVVEVMKSVKQLLQEKQYLFTSAGDAISWSHLESVEEFVRSDHTEWGLAPGSYSIEFMNFLKFLKVKTQKDPWPFGRYYPAAMKILQKFGANVLKNANPTLTFLQHMADITELFTSCSRFQEKKYHFTNDKTSLTSINKLIHYLENLKFPGGSFVKDGDRRMPIMNLCMNLSSLKLVLRRVFSESCGLFHRLTMNNVREFICGVVSNELLTPVQFKERYFSQIQKLDISPSAVNERPAVNKIREKFRCDSTFFSSKIHIYAPLRSMCDQMSNFFVEKVINVWAEAVDCPECFQVMADSAQTDRSNFRQDVARLIRRVETELCIMGEIPVDIVDKNFNAFANAILNGLISFDGFKLHSHLFTSAEFGSSCHFTGLVKNIVEIYLRLRLMYLAGEMRIGIRDFQESSLKYSLGQVCDS